jgi:hypothetical protein
MVVQVTTFQEGILDLSKQPPCSNILHTCQLAIPPNNMSKRISPNEWPTTFGIGVIGLQVPTNNENAMKKH